MVVRVVMRVVMAVRVRVRMRVRMGMRVPRTMRMAMIMTMLVIDRAAGHAGLNAVVMVLQIVQAQQVHAVVVAVGRAHQGMDVEFRG